MCPIWVCTKDSAVSLRSQTWAMTAGEATVGDESNYIKANSISGCAQRRALRGWVRSVRATEGWKLLCRESEWCDEGGEGLRANPLCLSQTHCSSWFLKTRGQTLGIFSVLPLPCLIPFTWFCACGIQPRYMFIHFYSHVVFQYLQFYSLSLIDLGCFDLEAAVDILVVYLLVHDCLYFCGYFLDMIPGLVSVWPE